MQPRLLCSKISVPATTPLARCETSTSMIWKLELTHFPFTLGGGWEGGQQQQQDSTHEKLQYTI